MDIRMIQKRDSASGCKDDRTPSNDGPGDGTIWYVRAFFIWVEWPSAISNWWFFYLGWWWTVLRLQHSGNSVQRSRRRSFNTHRTDGQVAILWFCIVSTFFCRAALVSSIRIAHIVPLFIFPFISVSLISFRLTNDNYPSDFSRSGDS